MSPSPSIGEKIGSAITGAVDNAAGLAEISISVRSEASSGKSHREQSRSKKVLRELSKDRRKELRECAKKSAHTQQLVKLSQFDNDLAASQTEAEPTSKFDLVLNALGVPLRMERFPLLPSKGHQCSDFRAPVATRLLLQFMVEGAGTRAARTCSHSFSRSFPPFLITRARSRLLHYGTALHRHNQRQCEPRKSTRGVPRYGRDARGLPRPHARRPSGDDPAVSAQRDRGNPRL